MDQTDTEVSARLRIRHSESTEQGASWNDTYTLLISDDDISSIKVYEADVPRYDAFFKNDSIALDDIPDPVLAAMQKYVDGSIVNWPSSPSPKPADVQREEAEVTLKTDDADYSFIVYGGEHVRIKKDGNPLRLSDVPQEIESEAEKFIPQKAQYL